jgi:hypothetical protein
MMPSSLTDFPPSGFENGGATEDSGDSAGVDRGDVDLGSRREHAVQLVGDACWHPRRVDTHAEPGVPRDVRHGQGGPCCSNACLSSQVRPSCARGAIPATTPAARCLLDDARSPRRGRVVVPADGLELPHRSDARRDGEVALAADLGGRGAAGVAGHAEVGCLNSKEGHRVNLSIRSAMTQECPGSGKSVSFATMRRAQGSIGTAIASP